MSIHGFSELERSGHHRVISGWFIIPTTPYHLNKLDMLKRVCVSMPTCLAYLCIAYKFRRNVKSLWSSSMQIVVTQLQKNNNTL